LEVPPHSTDHTEGRDESKTNWKKEKKGVRIPLPSTFTFPKLVQTIKSKELTETNS